MRPVTVDTGGPNDIFRGARVVWLHVPRGGYGYEIHVPATVVAVGKHASTIEVITADLRVVRRVVPTGSLRWRTL